MNYPKITVLMPVYNGETFLQEAIESILGQTFTDFEFLIINDGSTDSSVEIINNYQDPRVKLIHNEKNIGLIKSLNKGLQLSQGKLIARMDADDISYPDRLEKQYHFLNKNKKAGAVGSWFQMIYSKKIIRHPVSHEDIAISLLQYNPLGHPTVMIKKDLIFHHQLFYDEKFLHAEDYELWTRCINYFQLTNIPEVLLQYRDHPEQVGMKYRLYQNEVSNSIRISQIRALGVDVTEEERALHLALINGQYERSFSFIQSANQWLEKLQKQNQKSKKYREENFSKFLASFWTPLLLTADFYNKNLLNLYKKSSLSPFSKISLWNKIKFYIKCFLKK